MFEKSTKVGWHNSVGYSSDIQVVWVARLSSNSKKRENILLTNKEDGFYWNTFVIQWITSEKCLLSWQKEEDGISWEEEWQWDAVSMKPMSLKSGTSNFYKVCRLFGVPQV